MSRAISIHDIAVATLGRNNVLAEALRAAARTSAAGTPRKPRVQREHAEQVQLFEWAEQQLEAFPVLALLFAIPNFAGRLGKRTAKHGADLKAEGRKRGVPDVFLPARRGPYAGLFVEMKAEGGRTSDEQTAWISALREQGYSAVVCVGFEAARDTILFYLSLPIPPSAPTHD